MTVIRLGLRWAVLGLMASAAIGCASQPRPGDDSGVVLFGAVADVYTVCFHLSSDATRLEPSVVCDPEGVTPYSFNIEVEEGTDGNGDPCGPWGFRFEDPLDINPDGTFSLPPVVAPLDPVIVATLSSAGSVETGTGAGTATNRGGEGSCEVLWNASTTPVCFEVPARRCNRLLTCCESIYLLPPVLANCIDVVNACNPDTCEEVLAGYIECPQPPVCEIEEDPDGFCVALNECCKTADIDESDELEECLETAKACEPEACESLLTTLVDMFPECSLPPDMGPTE